MGKGKPGTRLIDILDWSKPQIGIFIKIKVVELWNPVNKNRSILIG